MNKEKIEDIVEGLEGVRDAMDKLNNILRGGPASYYYERIIHYYEGCMAAAKFKVGDRVELREDYTGDATGWAHCKHFMIRGAVATVKHADYYKGKYRYEIEFDNETWIDDKGIKRAPSNKHHFIFGQKDLKRHKV